MPAPMEHTSSGRPRRMGPVFAFMAMLLVATPAAGQGVASSPTDPEVEGITWQIDATDASIRLDGGAAVIDDACGSGSFGYVLEPDILGIRITGAALSDVCPETSGALAALADADGYEVLLGEVRLVDGAARPVVRLVELGGSAVPSGTWVATGFDAAGTGELAEPRAVLSVTFGRDGALDGMTDCGGFLGAYGIDGETIGIGVVAAGVSPCGDRARTEEIDFTTALQAAETWSATEAGIDLIDTAGSVRVQLVQLEAVTPEGAWLVTSYMGGDGVPREPIDGSGMAMRFGAAGQVEGSSGCRPFEGRSLIDAGLIVVGDIERSGPRCENPLRRQERRFFAALDQVVRWQRDGDRLDLLDGAGMPMISLAADRG